MVGLLLCAFAAAPADLPETPAVSGQPIQLVGWRDRLKRSFGGSRPAQPRVPQPSRPQANRTPPARQPAAPPANAAFDERTGKLVVREFIDNAVSEDVAWGDCGMDFEALLGRAVDKTLPLPPSERRAFVEGVAEAWRTDGGPVKALAAVVLGGGEIVPLAVRTRDGQTVVLTRQIHPGADFQYVEYLVRRTREGYRVVDGYKTADCEWMSETVGRMLAAKLAQDASYLETASEETAAACETMKRLQRVVAAVKRNEGQVGYEILDGLPETVRESRTARSLSLCLTAQSGDDDALAAATEAFRRDFPAEASAEILDLRLAKGKNLDAFLAADAALTAKGFVDPFRDAAVGVQLIKRGRLDEGVSRLESAAAAEPRNVAFPLSAAKALAEAGKADAAVRWLKHADREFLLEWRRLGEVVYAERFAGTPQQKAFLEYLGNRAPQPPAVEVAAPPEGTWRL